MDDFFDLTKHCQDELSLEWLIQNPKNLLLAELYIAEQQARRGGKRKTHDTHAFEANLFENLIKLRDDLWNCTYKPSRGTAHVIFRPVQREIFAAPYRDRIVQHWVVNTINPWWERRLSADSYSCRVGKGTEYGVKRLQKHILSVSENLQKPAYVVKLDITGYFMHIRRDLMYKRVRWGLDRQFEGQKNKRYQILEHAIREIIFDDPVKGVKIQGSYEDWRGLPEDKSLFCQPPGQGMVIGNLTSQVFSNIYLDALDRFIRFDLGYEHGGRYVDDIYEVVTEEQLPQMKRDIKVVNSYVNGMGLALNTKKTRIIPVWQGVPFLGMVVKGRAILPGKRIARNFSHAAYNLVGGVGEVDSIVSYMGMLSHCDSGRAIEEIFRKVGWDYNW